MCPSKPSIRCSAVSRIDAEIVDDDLFLGGTPKSSAASERSMLRGRASRDFRVHASTSGIAAKVSRLGLGGAAGDDDRGVRPLALQAADGLARLAHGFGRSPRNELTTIVLSSPAASALRRIVSDSAIFSRQPKVTTSCSRGSSRGRRQHGCVEPAFELDLHRAGHQHMVVDARAIRSSRSPPGSDTRTLRPPCAWCARRQPPRRRRPSRRRASSPRRAPMCGPRR